MFLEVLGLVTGLVVDVSGLIDLAAREESVWLFHFHWVTNATTTVMWLGTSWRRDHDHNCISTLSSTIFSSYILGGIYTVVESAPVQSGKTSSEKQVLVMFPVEIDTSVMTCAPHTTAGAALWQTHGGDRGFTQKLKCNETPSGLGGSRQVASTHNVVAHLRWMEDWGSPVQCPTWKAHKGRHGEDSFNRAKSWCKMPPDNG